MCWPCSPWSSGSCSGACTPGPPASCGPLTPRPPSLRAQIDDIERRLAAATAASRLRQETEFVITHLGEDDEQAGARRAAQVEPVDSALFADLVLRETVVKAASLAHGLRRALAPETRNRIRFEMKREVKRSRKQRRSDLREARRDREAQQRAGMTDSEDAA